jgi:hypothetical protein
MAKMRAVAAYLLNLFGAVLSFVAIQCGLETKAPWLTLDKHGMISNNQRCAWSSQIRIMIRHAFCCICLAARLTSKRRSDASHGTLVLLLAWLFNTDKVDTEDKEDHDLTVKLVIKIRIFIVKDLNHPSLTPISSVVVVLHLER